MQIQINPIDCDGNICNYANVSLAVSSSVALRLVPVDGAGVEYPDFAKAVVGDPSDANIGVFMSTVAEAVWTLASANGI